MDVNDEDITMKTYFEKIITSSKYVFKALPMPNIKGLLALTKNEIKRDIREIERYLDDDQESDSSVRSSEILSSTYPVKPRKTLKVPIRLEKYNEDLTAGENGEDSNELDDLSAEDILEFMKVIEESRRHVFEAEREKEKLEIKYQAIRDSFITHATQFTTNKKEYENYFHAIQSIFIRLLRLHIYYSRQNRMIYDVLLALQYRRNAISILHQEIDRLKLIKQSKPDKNANNLSHNNKGHFILRITLQPSEREIVFFVGQSIQTPMGIGEILSITYNETYRNSNQDYPNNVQIKLSYGIMYSNIMTILSWGQIDVSSDEYMCNKWSNFDRSLSIPENIKMKIKNLVQGLREEGGEPLTDNDECSGDDDSIEVASDCEDSDKGSEEPPAHPSSTSLRLKSSVHRTSSSILNLLDAAHIPSHMDSLPLIMAPPAALPSYIDQLLTVKDNHSIRYCRNAFLEGGQKGTTGAIAWEGDIETMMNEFESIVSEIKSLQEAQVNYMRLVERARLESSRLIQLSSSLRLSTFTARVRHRHNLGANAVTQLSIPSTTVAATTVAAGSDVLEAMLSLQPQSSEEKEEENEKAVSSDSNEEQQSDKNKKTKIKTSKSKTENENAKNQKPNLLNNSKEENSKKRSREEKSLEIDRTVEFTKIVDQDSSSSLYSKKPKRSGAKY